jgi:hypothetical protein
MSYCKRFMLIFVLVCLVPANPCPGVEDRPGQTDPLKKPPQVSETIRQIPGMTSGNATGTARGKKEDERKKSNAEPEKSDDRNGAKGTPLKEFVPSEKIEADQAVDFPSDI